MHKKGVVDLHLHSCFSDGFNSPEEVAETVYAAGVKLAVLTDHDTMKGVDRFIRCGEQLGLLVMPGLEVSTAYETRYDVHVLGINVNHNLGAAEELFECNNIERIQRTKKAINILNEKGFLSPTFDELTNHYEYPGRCVTLLHAMDFMVFHEGRDFGTARRIVMDMEQYGIHRNMSMLLTVEEGIKSVVELNGIPILAHPGELEKQIKGNEIERRSTLMSMLRNFKDMGLKGIEAYHSKHSSKEEADYALIAKQLGLHISAGSDYHGRHKICQDVGRPGMEVADVLEYFR